MIDSMVAASSRPIAAIRPSECPLCDGWHAQLRDRADQEGVDAQQAIVVSLDEFREHLSGHLEQIALFAIPPRFDAQTISGDSHMGKDRVGLPLKTLGPEANVTGLHFGMAGKRR
jgi:hypothetical protein